MVSIDPARLMRPILLARAMAELELARFSHAIARGAGHTWPLAGCRHAPHQANEGALRLSMPSLLQHRGTGKAYIITGEQRKGAFSVGHGDDTDDDEDGDGDGGDDDEYDYAYDA